MRMLLTLTVLAAALNALVAAQEPMRFPVDKETHWIGVYEWSDWRGRLLMPITAKLTAHENGTISGEWTGPRSIATGQITGRMDGRGKVNVTVTIFTGSERSLPSGATELEATERCSASAAFDGMLTSSTVMRLTAERFPYNTKLSQARNRDCEDSTRLVFTLQPHIDRPK